MESDVIELAVIEEEMEMSLAEMAARSRFNEAELLELLDCGAIGGRGRRTLAELRTAGRLRSDFELDLHGVALAMTLLRRIQELEAALMRQTMRPR